MLESNSHARLANSRVLEILNIQCKLDIALDYKNKPNSIFETTSHASLDCPFIGPNIKIVNIILILLYIKKHIVKVCILTII